MIIPPPRDPDHDRILGLQEKLHASINAAINAAQESNTWPAVANVPAGCHVRAVKQPVLEACRASGWLVLHALGQQTITIKQRPPRGLG